jgi:hypothetical protein
MNPFVSIDRRLLVGRLALAAVVLLVIVAGAIAAGRLQAEPSAAPAERPRAVSSAPSHPEGMTAADSGAPPSSTAQAEAFAREVAHLLFTWDSVAGPEPATIRGEVVALGDPAGEETPGLLVDLDAYLPDDVTWRHLDGLGARQWIEVDTATVPAVWADSVTHEPGLADTYAVNVAGTRHREATAPALVDRTENPMQFAAFIRCPADEPCSLLRLGRLGETWEG